MYGRPYKVAIDIEASGKDSLQRNPAAGFYPVSIAMVKYDADGNEVGQLYYAIKWPGGDKKWRQEAQNIHGISRADLAKDSFELNGQAVQVVEPAQIVDEIRAMLQDADIIAHRATMDRFFFNEAFAELGLELPLDRLICTYALASIVEPHQAKGLKQLASRAGYKFDEQYWDAIHDALDDTIMAYDVFRYLSEYASEDGHQSVYLLDIVASIFNEMPGIEQYHIVEDIIEIIYDRYNAHQRRDAQNIIGYLNGNGFIKGIDLDRLVYNISNLVSELGLTDTIIIDDTSAANNRSMWAERVNAAMSQVSPSPYASR